MNKNTYTFSEYLILKGLNILNESGQIQLDKLIEIEKQFEIEYINKNNKNTSKISTFSQWLTGLPNEIYIPFMNYQVLEEYELYQGKKFDNSDINYTNDVNAILDDYFTKLAKAFFELKENI